MYDDIYNLKRNALFKKQHVFSLCIEKLLEFDEAFLALACSKRLTEVISETFEE